MSEKVNTSFLLRQATLLDRGSADVFIANGVIQAIGDGAAVAAQTFGATQLDLREYVLLPAPAEPHAHLDKALLADRVPNPAGDLVGAIDAVDKAYRSMSAEDIETRAARAIALAVARGYTAIRTHVDCETAIGTRGVEALVRLRDRLLDVVDLQIVANPGMPISGPLGRENQDALLAALGAGVDLVGGCPAIDPDPKGAIEVLVRIAAEAGRDLDLHIDETTDASCLCLVDLAAEIERTGFDRSVTASHCVSLGVQSAARCREVATAVARAGIMVVTLPQTNLYLQGRGSSTNKPRGLTAIEELRRAGAVVAGGGDNWRDPFNPMGRIDPLETASLLVTAGHLSVVDAYAAVSERARLVMGLAEAKIEPSYPADLLAVRGTTLAEAIADASEQRMVFHAGRLLARTDVKRTLSDPLANARLGPDLPALT